MNDSHTLSAIAIAVAALSGIGSWGAMFQWNQSRNKERDRDRDRMSRMEGEINHLREALHEEKVSINAHLDRIYNKLDELVKVLYAMKPE